MKLDEMVTGARDALSARRVFAEPVERNGVTVIGVAAVGGGGGGGQGQDEQGEGGGFGLGARPVGAYELKDGKARWVPAVDVNRLLVAFAAVLGIFLITRARIVMARLKAASKTA